MLVKRFGLDVPQNKGAARIGGSGKVENRQEPIKETMGGSSKKKQGKAKKKKIKHVTPIKNSQTLLLEEKKVYNHFEQSESKNAKTARVHMAGTGKQAFDKGLGMRNRSQGELILEKSTIAVPSNAEP